MRTRCVLWILPRLSKQVWTLKARNVPISVKNIIRNTRKETKRTPR